MPPINDDFVNAILLTGASGTVSGDNTGATFETGEPISQVTGGTGLTSVWYKWTVPTDGDYTFTLSGPTTLMVGEIWVGTALDNIQFAVFNLFISSPNSVSTYLLGGMSVYIRILGYHNTMGPFTLDWAYASLTQGVITDPGQSYMAVGCLVDGAIAFYNSSATATEILGYDDAFNNTIGSISSIVRGSDKIIAECLNFNQIDYIKSSDLSFLFNELYSTDPDYGMIYNGAWFIGSEIWIFLYKYSATPTEVHIKKYDAATHALNSTTLADSNNYEPWSMTTWDGSSFYFLSKDYSWPQTEDFVLSASPPLLLKWSPGDTSFTVLGPLPTAGSHSSTRSNGIRNMSMRGANELVGVALNQNCSSPYECHSAVIGWDITGGTITQLYKYEIGDLTTGSSPTVPVFQNRFGTSNTDCTSIFAIEAYGQYAWTGDINFGEIWRINLTTNQIDLWNHQNDFDVKVNLIGGVASINQRDFNSFTTPISRWQQRFWPMDPLQLVGTLSVNMSQVTLATNITQPTPYQSSDVNNFGYTWLIDWGDGNFDYFFDTTSTLTSKNFTHTYASNITSPTVRVIVENTTYTAPVEDTVSNAVILFPIVGLGFATVKTQNASFYPRHTAQRLSSG